jgi:hypothetical protein
VGVQLSSEIARLLVGINPSHEISDCIVHAIVEARTEQQCLDHALNLDWHV